MSPEVTAYLPQVASAYSVLLVGMLSPGPAVALLLGVAGEQGRSAALITAMGIGCGSAVLGLGATYGLNVLCTNAPWIKVVVQYLGAALLLWRAIRSARKAILKARVQVADVPAAMSPPQLILIGFLLQVTNIGALVFWIAAISAGKIAIGPTVLLAPFALGGAVMSGAINAAYALTLSSGAARRTYNRARRVIEAVLAIFLAYTAVRIVMRTL